MTDHGDLDISFVPNGTHGYADLVRDATEMEIDGVRVSVASLADIIRSKQAANRDKDLRVLPVLRRILAEG
jgi:predicted nucleotidyltransferase